MQPRCSQVWVKPELREDGRVYFVADSDSQLTKGLAALLVLGLSGCTPQVRSLQVAERACHGGMLAGGAHASEHAWLVWPSRSMDCIPNCLHVTAFLRACI